MALKPLTTEQLTNLVETLSGTELIVKTAQDMPAKLSQELTSNATLFLQGYLEGITRAMQVAQSVQLCLHLGQNNKAAMMQAMLNATTLICARELLKRGEEEKKVETSDD
jgi:hypothetical protein